MESNHKQDARFVKARDNPKRNGDSVSHASVWVMSGLVDMSSMPRIQDVLASFLIRTLVSLSMVESPAFRGLLHAVRRGTLHIPDLLMKRAIEEKAEVKKNLRVQLGEAAGVPFTTDGWIFLSGGSYIAVTVHWVDQDAMQLEGACLAVRATPGGHTAKRKQ
ncbi:unnamed protein product [Discosporangium mesarthrocarpum]